MSHKFFGLVFLVFAIVSCTNKHNSPGGILSPKDMQSILWDVLRADALAPELIKYDSSLKITAINIDLYNQVFTAHKIDRDAFINSFHYYEKNPELMRSLLDSLNKEQQRRMLRRFALPKQRLDTLKS